jgi:hypothetical protein
LKTDGTTDMTEPKRQVVPVPNPKFDDQSNDECHEGVT